ncbi:hypothetical protein AC579_4231 [Pseudocercospora musae]|uniref:Uncharacterized protein n=1 Tax=Pseudocercospora musae TaxID=113226 RepID=A0A139IDD5_9PEZI|nr:hypothetical protein AC579_4231 [Pseudocercospora musae]
MAYQTFHDASPSKGLYVANEDDDGGRATGLRRRLVLTSNNPLNAVLLRRRRDTSAKPPQAALGSDCRGSDGPQPLAASTDPSPPSVATPLPAPEPLAASTDLSPLSVATPLPAPEPLAAMPTPSPSAVPDARPPRKCVPPHLKHAAMIDRPTRQSVYDQATMQLRSQAAKGSKTQPVEADHEEARVNRRGFVRSKTTASNLALMPITV